MVARLTPPDRFRKGLFRQGFFTTALSHERVASFLGIALGVAFLTMFVTGMVSHLVRSYAEWFPWPSRPVWLYRVNQGLHVTAGIAAFPLLFAKLWSVWPKLFVWPPVASAAHLVERLSLAPLVGGSIFMMATGIPNITTWYPWGFSFVGAHYAGAWITLGALVVHLGAKLRIALTNVTTPDPAPPPEAVTRRRFLAGVFATSGLFALVTVGQTVRPLRHLGFLAPRDPTVGPQGLPVNKSAVQAGVEGLDVSQWRLVVDGRVTRPLELSLAEVSGLPQHTASLPITCVEGWSADGVWTGVRLSELVEMAGGDPRSGVRVYSVQSRGPFTTSLVFGSHAIDPDTLLALKLHGEELHPDHGYPCRLIAPNRPGVQQTKWLRRIEVL